MPLTDSALRALKPLDRPYIVTDGRGLYVEVFPTGGVVWRYRYRFDGRTEKLTLGKYPALSLKTARLKRDDAEKAAVNGTSPARIKRLTKAGQSASPTVTKFSELYLREVVAKDWRDITAPKRYFDNDILPAIGTKQIASVTAEDVRRIIWSKKDHGFDAAAGHVRGLLKRMFDYAITSGVATHNPVLTLPMRHVYKAKSRERSLSIDEIGAFLSTVFQSHMRRQFKVALHLILLTMVRKSELMKAQWPQLQLDVSEWHIPGTSTKTGKPHIVYLSTQAVKRFKELKVLACGSEYVLPGRGKADQPFHQGALNVALRAALADTGMNDVTIHDLRRTASTVLHENGWPADVIEKALNHTIGGVRGVYNRAEYAKQRREMLQFWADLIDKQIQPDPMLLAQFAAPS